jgi:hypothetical protein
VGLAKFWAIFSQTHLVSLIVGANFSNPFSAENRFPQKFAFFRRNSLFSAENRFPQKFAFFRRKSLSRAGIINCEITFFLNLGIAAKKRHEN